MFLVQANLYARKISKKSINTLTNTTKMICIYSLTNLVFLMFLNIVKYFVGYHSLPLPHKKCNLIANTVIENLVIQTVEIADD